MNIHILTRELAKARSARVRGERPDYWLGYERGLMRGHRGAGFGTDHDHDLWLSLAASGDARLRERGKGYRDGLVVAAAEEAA
jgi:hypothetical protein